TENRASATVSIATGTFVGDGDVLFANTAGTSITASYNSATETLILTGSDTLAHYQTVLDTVTFNSTSDNPDDFGSNTTPQVTWGLNDRAASFSQSAATNPTTVNVTAINDAPTITAATTDTFVTGEPLTLSPTLSVTDPDSLTLANATVSVTAGTFALDGDVLFANTAGT